MFALELIQLIAKKCFLRANQLQAIRFLIPYSMFAILSPKNLFSSIPVLLVAPSLIQLFVLFLFVFLFILSQSVLPLFVLPLFVLPLFVLLPFMLTQSVQYLVAQRVLQVLANLPTASLSAPFQSFLIGPS